MRIKDPDNDFRYPITIILMREGRPKYWEFHCPYCTAKVCELEGTMIQGRDISNNTDSGNNSFLRARCPGTKQVWCKIWYEFQLFE